MIRFKLERTAFLQLASCDCPGEGLLQLVRVRKEGPQREPVTCAALQDLACP